MIRREPCAHAVTAGAVRQSRNHPSERRAGREPGSDKRALESTAARAENASRLLALPTRSSTPGRLLYFGFVALTGTGSRASFVSAKSSSVPARTA